MFFHTVTQERVLKTGRNTEVAQTGSPEDLSAFSNLGQSKNLVIQIILKCIRFHLPVMRVAYGTVILVRITQVYNCEYAHR